MPDVRRSMRIGHKQPVRFPLQRHPRLLGGPCEPVGTGLVRNGGRVHPRKRPLVGTGYGQSPSLGVRVSCLTDAPARGQLSRTAMKDLLTSAVAAGTMFV